MTNLRTFLAAGLVCGLGVFNTFSQDQDTMPQKHQKALEFQRKITTEVRVNYLLHLPSEYKRTNSKRWPLILFLHGAGERGTNVWLVAKHGPPKIVKNQLDFPFIVISPQCPSGQRWSNPVLLALLDETMKKYKVDPKRVYLSGLSMGGYGTWSLALANPERFAAIVPICGGGEVIDVLLAGRAKERALKSLGVWAFHGAKDSSVRLEESQRMVDALKRAGCPDVKLTIYPEAGHDSWTETYDNPEVYEWLLKHSRD